MGPSDTNGFTNTVRPMGRNSRSSRTLTDDGTTHRADDSVLGLGAIVVVGYMEPDVEYTLVDLSESSDPGTGGTRAEMSFVAVGQPH